MLRLNQKLKSKNRMTSWLAKDSWIENRTVRFVHQVYLLTVAIDLKFVAISSMAMKSIESGRKGTKKHYSWGIWISDSRYPDELPEGRRFINFPKPSKEKEGISLWEKEHQAFKTEKARRWLHACGRKDFTKVSQVRP